MDTEQYCLGSFSGGHAVGIVLYVCNTKAFSASSQEGLLPAAPPEETPCGLQHLPDSVELALHILELKQVAEDELILSHGLLADHNAQWPLYLQAITSQADLSPAQHPFETKSRAS